jgi:nitrate/nitrite-specific signal transduction histidine kinase
MAMSAAAILALIATNHITRPIQALVKVAEEIREGDLSQRTATSGLQELDALATTFNGMTDQLRQTLEGLEQRVTDRTQALKTSAEVSRYLSTILDTNKLVMEVADCDQPSTIITLISTCSTKRTKTWFWWRGRAKLGE